MTNGPLPRLSSIFNPYLALLYRSYIHRRRTVFASLLLFLLPIAFVFVLFALKGLAENSDNFAKSTQPSITPATPVLPPTFSNYVSSFYTPKTCASINVGSGTGFKKNNNPMVSCNPFGKGCLPFLQGQGAGGNSAVGECLFAKLVITIEDANSALQTNQALGLKSYIETVYPQTLQPSPSSPLDVFVEFMPSQSALDSYITSQSYSSNQQVAFGIVFTSTSASSPTYYLRQNSTYYQKIWNTYRPNIYTTARTDQEFKEFQASPVDSCAPDKQGGPSVSSKCVDLYMMNGVLTMQRLVNDYILSDPTKPNNVVAQGGVGFVYFPNEQYEEDGFWGQIALFLPLFYLIGMIYPVIWTTKIVVTEKEMGMAALLKTNSVTQSMITVTHMISFTLFYIPIAILSSLASASVFSNSSLSLIIALLVLFWISTITFCLFCASLFMRSKIASTFAVLIYCAGYFVTYAQDISEGSRGALIVLSLHPMGALTYALEVMAEYEDEGVGLTALTSGVSPYPKTGYTFDMAVGLMALGIIITWVGAWYFERVLGTPREKVWFLFRPRYWFPIKRGEDPHETPSPTNDPDELFMEKRTPNGGPGPCVRVANLVKQYGRSPVASVDRLSLDIYPSEITSILGHNGAGKTSAFMCMTGMTSITEGDVHVDGVSVKEQPQEAKKSIGYCPQHNILYDWMTCYEHVKMFGIIKGCPIKEVDEEVTQALNDVALSSKKNSSSKNLSGGMKRKLLIAMSFIGNSRVVFLDEPTSGMDVHSRRFIWSLVRKKRNEGRAVILSTHFLDEADILSDRIAILSKGRLKCLGSPMFLKRAYGVGYQLNIENTRPPAIDAMDRTRQVVPEAKLLTDVGAEVTIQLPTTSQHLFPALMREMEERKSNNEIVTFGVGVTTLESVFLLIEESAHEDSTDISTDEFDDLILVESSEKKPPPLRRPPKTRKTPQSPQPLNLH